MTISCFHYHVTAPLRNVFFDVCLLARCKKFLTFAGCKKSLASCFFLVFFLFGFGECLFDCRSVVVGQTYVVPFSSSSVNKKQSCSSCASRSPEQEQEDDCVQQRRFCGNRRVKYSEGDFAKKNLYVQYLIWGISYLTSVAMSSVT